MHTTDRFTLKSRRVPMLAFNGNNQEYLDFISNKYFHVCRDARVLEVGGLKGDHSKKIIEHCPAYLEVIEPHVSLANDLTNIEGIDQIVTDDALLLLSSPRPFDVVICFGVLYHLHSPIHLLELFVNHCRPKYLMLDSVGEFSRSEVIKYDKELVNDLGTRQVRSDWKFSGLKIVTNGQIFNQALNNMGYQLIQSNHLNVSDNFSKSNSWVGLWQNKETL